MYARLAHTYSKNMRYAKFKKGNYLRVIKMAEDDIYGSKNKYFMAKEHILNPKQGKLTKYPCLNSANLAYFEKLFRHFEAKDLSYIRRIRVMQSFKFICNSTKKDLPKCERDDIDCIMSRMHQIYNTPKSKETFIKDLKHCWKILFPENDERGRPDETIVPYVVRHLSAKSDKSRQKLRTDKFTYEEFERILNYFSADLRMQAYLSLSLESLARPQELLYTKIGDIEPHNNYAKIFISEHGKEGVGMLQCIDSFPYLLKWLAIHPLKNDKSAFLFINIGNHKRYRQLKPTTINKLMHQACQTLNINKPITCYSLKRNGVTLRRLRGDSDVEIQHAARWTSTKQLKTYDLSSQDEAFKIALQKRGLLENDKAIQTKFETKKCPYCNELIGFSETVCPKCKHIVSRNEIIKDVRKDETIATLTRELDVTKNMTEQVMQEMMEKILAAKNG